MKVHWLLGWAKTPAGPRDFKNEGAHLLFQEYLKRIGHFSECSASGLKKGWTRPPQTKLWVCDTSKKARMLSSEELSREVSKLQLSGVKEVIILIGGPDGLASEGELLKSADLLWSFGPMTLPHELAAVVSAEQIYRAFTILKGLPYHSGH